MNNRKNNNVAAKAENNYELVEYIPTIGDLQAYYLDKRYPDYDGHYLRIEIYDGCQYVEAPELQEEFDNFYEMIHSHHFFDFLLEKYVNNEIISYQLFDLFNKATGELFAIRRYSEIVSYHPNEGYAFVKKDGNDLIQLLSLNSAFPIEVLFSDVSGIEDLFFRGRLASKSTNDIFYIIKDFDLLSSVVFEDFEEENHYYYQLPDINGKDFEPAKFKNGIPFYQDPTFLKAIQNNLNLRILVPDHVKRSDEIIEDVKNLERLRNEHPERDKIFASLKKDTHTDEEASSYEMPPLGEDDLPF